MVKRVSAPPPEADPAEVWAPLDRLVRELLPTYLEALGFPLQAARLRALPAVADAASAAALERVRRELAGEIFVENCALADAASALRRAGADELEVLRARRLVDDPRFDRASTMLGLVLSVAGSWAANTALGPGPWPNPRRSAAIALDQVRYCERAMLPDRYPIAT